MRDGGWLRGRSWAARQFPAGPSVLTYERGVALGAENLTGYPLQLWKQWGELLVRKDQDSTEPPVKVPYSDAALTRNREVYASFMSDLAQLGMATFVPRRTATVGLFCVKKA